MSASRRASPSSQALAKAAICAVGSVPLQAILLPAAQNEGLQLQAVSMYMAPIPFGGVNLMSADGQQVNPQALGRKGHLQKGLHRVAVEQRRCAGAPDDPDCLPTGSTLPSSLFTSIMDTRTVSGRSARSSSARSTVP